MRKLNIVFVTAADLPQGGGNTTRLKTLVSAIAGMGHNVNILLEHSHGVVSPEMLQKKGDIDGVPFEYITGSATPPKGINFFTTKLQALVKLRSRIRQIHNKEAIDILWFNQSAAHLIYPLTKLANKLNIKTVHSYEDERIKGNGLKRKLIYTNQALADTKLSFQADHIVVISHYLKNKYGKLTKHSKPITIIPTVVDIDFWDCTQTNTGNTIPKLIYTGGFYGFDEIEEVIKAVKILKKKGTVVHFDLIGYNKKSPDYMASIEAMIQDMGLQSQIKMLGFIPFEELKSHLEKSDLLIGIRKDQNWSSTGFSTKLSEYLSTGKPILCADIGDNKHYLTDNESAFVLPSGVEAPAIADKIAEILKDQVFAKKVGETGQDVAKKNFSREVVQQSLKDMFINMRLV